MARSPRVLSAALTAGLVASPALAETIAYVEASSELDDGRPASSAYNLIDGKETTAWCSTERPGEEELVFGFLAPVEVTEVALVAGALKGEGLDPGRQRIKQLRLSGGQTQRTLRLKDEAGLQRIRLDPPARGKRIIVEVRETYAADRQGAPVCLGELRLMHENRALTSSASLNKQVRALNTPSRRLLRMWVDEPSAAERTLTFSLDGTFRYQFEPLLEGEPVRFSGQWRAAHNKLSLEVKGKRYALKTRLSRIDDGERQVDQLTLVGDAPHPSLLTDFRAAPSRYE